MNLVKSLLAIGVFCLRVHAQEIEKNKVEITLPENKPKIGEQIQRRPGFSDLELKIERLPSGKIKVVEVDPKGPFRFIEEGQIYDDYEDIPPPREYPDHK
jgi:guanyl-specific ribonuclease Sa